MHRVLNEKQYDGYQSFNYLNSGTDYQSFSLSDKINRVPSYDLALTEDQEQSVNELFKKNSIISLRDHGFIVPEKREDIVPYCSQLHTFFHYEGLSYSGIDAMFENFMDGITITSSKNGLKWAEVIEMLGIRYADITKQRTVYIATTFEDIINAKELKKVALLPSLEAANILENELDRVDILYGLGIRCMGITYNEANTLGSGLVEKNDGGLTNFGRRVIERMNTLGMAIDISHCHDQTSLDVIECSQDPVFITHAGARALWQTPRMKPDEVLKACAKKGGVIGMCAAPNTTLTHTHPDHSIESVMEHFEYIYELVGIDHIGLGPDTFYGDHTALQQEFDNRLRLSDSHQGESFEESDYVNGLENPSEAMINMVKWLVKNNYIKTDIQKAAGENALRALKVILQK
ncbi:dipeptidase [Salibacterium aidingense]|uniref:dipeptidase n=1 Tax=Salibacterium aidingense TaxID=384933 RepID=UPI00040F92DB|nr:membrane dipeptidase [Salibacterium aidingense]